MIRILFTTILVSSVLLSCNEKPREIRSSKDKTDYYSTVKVPAGDIYPAFDTYQMPTFFNVGEIQISENDAVSSIIIGPRLSKRKKVDIIPIASFAIDVDSVRMEYVVSHLQDFSDDDLTFEMFMVKHADVVSGIESWFKSQCLMGQCGNIKWSNSYKALLEINNSNLKN